MIKAISLDFWGTIAVFNPAYSAARTKLFSEVLNLPENEAAARYLVVKRSCDHDAEQTGAAITPLIAMKRVLQGTDVCAVEVLDRLEDLVRRHPPLLHPGIQEALHDLKRCGVIVGVSSNTNFIAGSLVQSIFNLPWDFAVYSDELGVSKPSRDFFRTVATRVRRLDSSVLNRDIVHLGDNTTCDFRGAQEAGLRGEYVRSPDETLDYLHAFLENITPKALA